MKRGTTWKAALLAVVAACTPARPAAADDALTLRRVLLSSGGVGYFEYEARVQGDADLSLAVPLDQVDDVLKSIVVYDTQGNLGQATLPGKDAASRIFHDLPFDATALASEPALLDALRGAEVRVTTERGTIQGRILSVTPETIQLPDNGGTIQKHRLALAGADGTVSSVLVEDTLRITFVDPTLQRQIDDALAAGLGQNERQQRTFQMHISGQGERAVRVAYVVATPVWKSTYRLTLPADPAVKNGTLQGFSVVDNQSGTDWRDVDLTLVSGNPVTFRQALYASYYVNRPEIPVEVAGQVLPRLDTGAVSVGGATPAPNETLAPPAPQAGRNVAAAFGGFGYGGAGAEAPIGGSPSANAPAALPYAGVTPAESTETATQVVFHIPTPVSVADGQQALIPLIDREIPAERVSVYQPDVNARNPIASVELTNDSDTGLPPGVVTTYERSAAGIVTYVGDARLATLPQGEQRLVSFGVDPKVTIDRTDKDVQVLTLATIDGGVLQLTRTERRVTDYTIAGAAHEPRVVILEHARVAGFDLAAPRDKLVGTTDTVYRLRIDVPAGSTVPVEVSLERPVVQSVVIANLTAAALTAYATSSELPAPVRDAMAHAATLRQAADDKAKAVTDLEAERTRLTDDQARIRQNLGAVPAGGDLAQRYLTMMGQDEDAIAATDTQLTAARSAQQDAETALSDYIRSLHL